MKTTLIYSLKVWLVSILVASAVSAYIVFFSGGEYFQYQIIPSIKSLIIVFTIRIILFVCAWAFTILLISKNVANNVVKKIGAGLTGVILSKTLLFIPNFPLLITPEYYLSTWDITYILTYIICIMLFKFPQSINGDKTKVSFNELNK